MAVTLLLLMFAAALFGDVFVWAIYGTKFVLSPRFNQVEGWLRSLIGIGFMGFLGFERGAEHLQQKRWKPFLFGVVMVIAASIPFAKPCAILVRFTVVKGTVVLSQPKIALMVFTLMLIFVCKCQAVFSIWKLARKTSESRETRRIVISQ